MSTLAAASLGAEEIVSVPVPKKYLAPVIQALARLIDADEKANQEKQEVSAGFPWPTDDEEPIQGEIDWTQENLRKLRGVLWNKNTLALLDLTSEKPGARVYLHDVSERSGCTHGQASGSRISLTKAIKRAFGFKGNAPAPIQWDGDQNLAYYTMTPEVAAAWKASAVATN